MNATPQELASRGYVLQDLVHRYPWFSLGHYLLFKALCGLGGDASLSQSERRPRMYIRVRSYFSFWSKAGEEFEKLAEEEFFILDLPVQEPENKEQNATTKNRNDTKSGNPSYQGGKRTHSQRPRSGNLFWTFRKSALLSGADYFGKEHMDTIQLDVSTPIDRFISENPRFTQVLKRTGEDLDTSQQDAPPLLEDDEFVTETLAKIYADQGTIN